LTDFYISSTKASDTLFIEMHEVLNYYPSRSDRFPLVNGLLIRLASNPKRASYFFEKTYSSSQAIEYENRYKEREGY
jgi:hypothetical protein